MAVLLGLRGDDTRRALIVAARELFGEAGYIATSIEEIAASAGVSKGAIYHHFGSKASLFREVYERVAQEMSGKAASSRILGSLLSLGANW